MKQRLIRMVRVFKARYRGVVDSPERLKLACAEIATTVSRATLENNRERHILLASTGVRNIGDQAMLEAFIANVPGEIDVLVTSSSSYLVPEEARNRVRLLTFNALVYGRGRAHRADLARFCQLLARARSFSIVGADVIDGGYQLRAPMLSWALAAAVAQRRVDSRVLGFSWGESVNPLVVQAATAASIADVRLFARDPDSAERLAKDGVPGVREVVDMVFALGGEDMESAELQTLRTTVPAESGYVLLNVSGLIASTVDLGADYLVLARELYADGVHLVLVPHVDNRGGSDSAALREFARALTALGIAHTVIARLLRPKQMRALARGANFVVTGRMHLSVLALSCAVPAVVLSTQGKVSGMLRRVGYPEWCVQPQPGAGLALLAAARAIRALSAGELAPRATEFGIIAKKNFDGLG